MKTVQAILIVCMGPGGYESEQFTVGVNGVTKLSVSYSESAFDLYDTFVGNVCMAIIVEIETQVNDDVENHTRILRPVNVGKALAAVEMHVKYADGTKIRVGRFESCDQFGITSKMSAVK